ATRDRVGNAHADSLFDGGRMMVAAARGARILRMRSPWRGMFDRPMVAKGPGAALLGRRSEREVLDRLLEAVRGGQSGVLLVRGEPGIGKTALLEAAIESAAGFRIARAVGVESEMELAFAALQQLCAPMAESLKRLPRPQRDALRVALGISAG